MSAAARAPVGAGTTISCRGERTNAPASLSTLAGFGTIAISGAGPGAGGDGWTATQAGRMKRSRRRTPLKDVFHGRPSLTRFDLTLFEKTGVASTNFGNETPAFEVLNIELCRRDPNFGFFWRRGGAGIRAEFQDNEGCRKSWTKSQGNNMSNEPMNRRTVLRGLAGGTAAAWLWPAVTSAQTKETLDSLKQAVAARGGDPAAGDERFWGVVKRQFPIREGLIMLNAANLTPTPQVVVDRQLGWLRDIDADASPANRAKFEPLKEEARTALAEYRRGGPGRDRDRPEYERGEQFRH